MKKLIAISVMCALVAWAAFAETTVGGQVFVGGALLQGDNVKDSQPNTTAISNDQYNTALKITFSEGPAGGRIRILGKNAGDSNIFDEWFAWWRPIPQLRIQVGSNQDGDFGNAQISGWGFTGENKNNGGNQGALGEYTGDNWSGGRDHSRTVGWYGGTGGTPNIQFSIFAIEGLTVNLWIPFDADRAPGFTFSKFELNVGYRITDVGNITVSYQSDTGYLKGDAEKWYGAAGVTKPYTSDNNTYGSANSPKIFASFYLSAIENLGVDLGVAYAFPFNNTDDKIVYNFPFEVGLGFRYQISPDFQFRLRASATLGESEVTDGGDPVKKPTKISASINPNYKIGTVTVFFYGGIGLQAIEKDEWKNEKGGIFANSGSDTVMNWFISPYVFIPAGSLRFKVGFQLYSDGVGYPYYADGEQKFDQAKINWSIPIGFYTYF